MRLVNKTRYAILGMLLEGPSTGYEIKSLDGEIDSLFLARIRFDDLSDVESFGKGRKGALQVGFRGKEKERGLFHYRDRAGGI